MRRSFFWVGLAVVLGLLWGPAVAQGRSLYWREMAVVARLDGEGVLHVSERQTMVFSGEWNGGQRIFRLGAGQELEVERISRVEEDGLGVYPLMKGDLDQVDHYEWTGDDTVRWRSRLPSDPLFASTPITYVLEYRLSGVLKKEGELYRLDHDFAFPDREGPVERFSLELEVDPVWGGAAEIEGRRERENLPPGASVVVTAELTYQGESEPSAVLRSLPKGPVYALFAAALLAMLGFYLRFRRGEAALGRFDQPEVPSPPDRAWLEANVFDQSPELVGALWDETVGPPEVAAVLARMEMEGKLSSEVIPKKSFFGTDVLRLRYLAGAEELPGYEAKLMAKLFFDGRTETDTAAIRKHYKETGFQPASVIEPALKKQVRRIVKQAGPGPEPSVRVTLLLFTAFAVLVAAVAILKFTSMMALALAAGVLLLMPMILGLVFSYAWRKRVRRLDLVSLSFLVPAGFIWLICVVLARFITPSLSQGLWRPDWLSVLGLALLPVAFLSWVLFLARTRQGQAVIRKRQILAAAREELRRQLASRSPDLDDAWMPYLLAFGLHQDVDRWFKSFGGSSGSAVAASGGSFGGSGGGGGWSGGGGSFGGAGATASWGAAATGLAAGVSAPSSSGSGGGGGGGGSSGGGGGGGW